MSKIQEAFQKGKAFIPFVTCGDPDLETTAKIVRAMEEAGADIIELGIPFSDPTAEGPVIQAANIRALSGGVTTDKIFDFVCELRKDVKVPLVFMTYANVIFSYGIEKFAKKCAECGIDGLILPDVPHEEKDEFSGIFQSCGVDFISLIAPTSENRIATISADANGFLYVVSSLGVTGERAEIRSDIGKTTAQIRNYTKIPCAIGFGISTPEQAKEMSQYADGVIVGSAIVKRIGQYGRDAAPHVAEYVKSMKDAIR
ncbi:MAG: tryptophan synthase subunit alpha [Oscillospiraceae bacterium]|nr:tryptophan synthase subunit alpha [Oscillospiraceae bacterium]